MKLYNNLPDDLKSKVDKFIIENVKEYTKSSLNPQIIEVRKTEMPDNSYTTSLFNEGIKKITKKLGEEASEVIIASLAEKRSDLIYESADLIYHLLVLLANEDISLEEVVDELSSRHNKN